MKIPELPNVESLLTAQPEQMAALLKTLDKNNQELGKSNQLLQQNNQQLQQVVKHLQQRVDWFEKQLFGEKSEKRRIDNPFQDSLTGWEGDQKNDLPESPKQRISYERGKAKKRRSGDEVNDSGLRFDDSVRVKVIHLQPDELKGPNADEYEIIGTRKLYRLAQWRSANEVLEYHTLILKRKNKVITAKAPDSVIPGSIADVSFLTGLLVDKYCYHLPLHRQHQRLQSSGITLARSTLTGLCKKAIEQLRPVVQAMLNHIRLSRVLAMDETPIKAGRSKPGKLKKCWLWPIYGEQDEVVFHFSTGRGHEEVIELLGRDFNGTLLCDGHSAYTAFVKATEQKTNLAQCWVHARRYVLNQAEKEWPDEVNDFCEQISQLYRNEKAIKESRLKDQEKLDYRQKYSKPIVDELFDWMQQKIRGLTPSNSLVKGFNYLLKREHNLRLFLVDPLLQPDTNHVERSLRCIPMGRKNWMFAWTELGGEHLAIIQSLIMTCRLHDINPSIYLTDVLQRVAIHPAKDVLELTPRIWKEKFADDPLKSDLEKYVNNASE